MYIEINQISKKIKARSILENINITFVPGRVYGIQGTNGSGKTMLLRMVAGLVRPSSGEILIDGKRLGKDIEFPDKMGLLIENPAFMSSYSAIDNIKLLCAVRGEVCRDEICNAIKLVGLNPNDDLPYKKFSLGMKQRLGICGAIVESPDLLLLDEPTNALDSDGIDLMKNIISKYTRQSTVTIIASHDFSFLTQISHMIITISKGRIETMEEIK